MRERQNHDRSTAPRSLLEYGNIFTPERTQGRRKACWQQRRQPQQQDTARLAQTRPNRMARNTTKRPRRAPAQQPPEHCHNVKTAIGRERLKKWFWHDVCVEGELLVLSCSSSPEMCFFMNLKPTFTQRHTRMMRALLLFGQLAKESRSGGKRSTLVPCSVTRARCCLAPTSSDPFPAAAASEFESAPSIPSEFESGLI